MNIHSDLPFIRERIQELRSALFFSQSSSLLRMTTTIVSIVKVDDLGQIWFYVPRPRQALHEFHREFPSRLEFFRKGKGFFLHITGRAFIINDPEDLNSLPDDEIKGQAAGNMVLIKVKMGKAEYFESLAAHNHAGWWREFRTQLSAWLFNTRPGYRPYQMENPMPMLRPVA